MCSGVRGKLADLTKIVENALCNADTSETHR